MIIFGAGKIVATPLTDQAGNAVANPTPVALAVLQDISVDIDVETKTLHGEKQFPVAAGRGKGKISWKAKVADFTPGLVGSLYLGQNALAQRKGAVMEDPRAVPASTPYTITITPPSSGVFASDQGVVDATTGQVMQRVASAPTAGQYSVSGVGVYTFAAADASKAILLSYEYSIASSPTSQLYNITNTLMGYTPSFSTILFNQYMGKNWVMKLNSCVLGKLSLPFKNDDFTAGDIDAEAFADSGGNVGYICMY